MNPKIGVIMGSSSDWETMKHACDILDELQVPYEKKVVSAHRTPDLMFEYAATARERGIQVIIAGAGGAAHLPEWWQLKQHYLSLVYQFNHAHLMDLIHYYPSFKCRWRTCSNCSDWQSRSDKCRITCSSNFVNNRYRTCK